MCPHEILTVKGYALEDSYGKEWEERYQDCARDHRIHKRVIPVKEIVRLILKSAVETGTPFTFNRDLVNEANPNSHKGIIYCSNLCTEIAQNMSPVELVEQDIRTVDGETVVVTVTKPGDFVVCNLASLSLGKIDVTDRAEVTELTRSAVRALDNVIDLNFFPVPYAKINNLRYRPVGLGVSGYHHMLARNGISWESEEHLRFADQVFEQINYAAIEASCDYAAEKGRYELFEGSDWQTGQYFEKRGYVSEEWTCLKEKVASQGLRNGWLIAVAPTSSTSMLAGTKMCIRDRDMIDSGCFNVVMLTRIFRQAAESDIILNAHRINAGEQIMLGKRSNDFLFIRRDQPDAIISAMITLIKEKLPGYVHADPFDIQVMTPMRKGALGVERLNGILQEYLNPKAPSKPEKLSLIHISPWNRSC